MRKGDNLESMLFIGTFQKEAILFCERSCKTSNEFLQLAVIKSHDWAGCARALACSLRMRISV